MWFSKAQLFPLKLPDLGEGIHEVGQGQGVRKGADQDRLLDVGSQQDQAQDACGMAGAGDSPVGHENRSLLILLHISG